MMGNAAPAARLTGQNARVLSQLTLDKVVQFMLRLPTVFTEWARLAQGRTGWHRPFAIGKPFVRQPRGDTGVTPEGRRRVVVQRAAEVAEWRAVFDANNSN